MAPLNAAFVTLLTKSSYLAGTLVLYHSMVSVGTQYPLVVMVTPQLPREARDVLVKKGIPVRDIDVLLPEEGVHKLSDHDHRFLDTWTKLRAFELVEYDRVVLMDSDMIVRRNMDELVTIDLPSDWIASAHACACNPRKLKHYPVDWVPANCAYTPLEHPSALTAPSQITETSPRPYSLLNSGLVVLTPSHATALDIVHYIATSPLVPTFSFPDQDLLATYFKGKWKPLPWCYNALKTLRIIHRPLWRDEEIRCLHYILDDKPWKVPMGPQGTGGDYEELNRWWWDELAQVEAEMKSVEGSGWEVVEANLAAA